MIQGFKLDFQSEELRKHLEERAKYHAGKAEWYAGQVNNLKSGGVSETRHSNDPVGSLTHSMNDHKAKADLFSLMAKHVIPNETYRLDESDLSRLELISRLF